MTSESVSSTVSDPMKLIADALDSAVQSTKEGVEKARVTAADAVPAAADLLSQVAYKTCYGISFGVVYTTMRLIRVIPKDNAIIHGFVDGSHAAMDSVTEIRSR